MSFDFRLEERPHPEITDEQVNRVLNKWIGVRSHQFSNFDEIRILQKCLLDDQACRSKLYTRGEKNENQTHDNTRSELDFSTYINSFYESYWVAYTPIRNILLILKGSGRCWCTIRRQHPDGSSTTVRHGIVDLGDQAEQLIEVELETEARAGRVFVEFGVIDRPCELREVAWATFLQPLRKVAVGVALCTFNREQFLAETLERLLRPSEPLPIAKIIVVNQGAPFQTPQLHRYEHESDVRISFVAQANFGGAGGFTRGAMELLKDPDVSHVLFMDDDIELEPAHIGTAAAFAAYAHDEVVVGGQMLDLFKPSMMFEAGSCITPENLLKANHRALSLDEPSALRALANLTVCDFNAWWFSLIPASAFRRCGLPAPVFIRGDDQEFGIRLARSGVRTVSLPPVSVWHEPFYAKPPGWQLYYDLRNRLIFASLYTDQFRLDGAVQLLKRLLSMVLRYDYQQIHSIVLALDDYSKGPELIEETCPHIHARILAALNERPHCFVEAPAVPLASDAHPTDRLRARRRILSSLSGVLSGFPKSNPVGAECLMYAKMPLDLMTLGRSYILSDEGDHFSIRFTYSLWKTWHGLARCVWAIANYSRKRRRVAADWKKAMPGLTSFESWAARFAVEAES